jgi:hypothetical protein
MDYITLALVGLLLLVVGFVCGSRYRQARMNGNTRMQAAMALLGRVQPNVGGGPPAPPR